MRRLRFCAVVATGLSLSTLSANADAPMVALTIRLALRNSSGQVGCMLFASEKGFPKDANAAAQRKWCPIANAESVCSFDPTAPGTYAVACFHDENKNGKLDTGLLGIPTEGTAASNDAKGFMGPPSFKDAQLFLSAGPTELRLKVKY